MKCAWARLFDVRHVTLRRAVRSSSIRPGRFDPDQIDFLRIWPKAINIDHTSRGEPFHNAALLRRRATKRNVSVPVDLLRPQR
jgi:hypothetical protein